MRAPEWPGLGIGEAAWQTVKEMKWAAGSNVPHLHSCESPYELFIEFPDLFVTNFVILHILPILW